MKILIYSPLFYPSIGGVETVVSILAHEFCQDGHEVRLVSQTQETDSKIFPFSVIRRPSPAQLLELARWCDLYFQCNISLKGIWPLLLVHKPLATTHQSWYCRLDNRLGWQDYLKRFVTHFATNISASQALAERLPAASTVIPNPYREDIFFTRPEISRSRELVFLGRLVSDKGADLLLEALVALRATGLTPKLTLIGSGPEELKLKQQAQAQGLEAQVEFVGSKTGRELAERLNAHQILVVPSRWLEPFGIVALEGIACGCVIVGSAGGGLKEAIGPCGLTFANGDVQALARVIADLLLQPEQLASYRAGAASHLSRHTKAAVAKAYLEIFERIVQ